MNNSFDDFYTESEKTERKYTVGFAIASAERRLKSNRHFRGGVNITAVAGRGLKEMITLREVNRISESIYYDSLDRGR